MRPQPCYNGSSIMELANSIDWLSVRRPNRLPFEFRRVGKERRGHMLGTWTKVLVANEVLEVLPEGVDLHISDYDVVSHCQHVVSA